MASSRPLIPGAASAASAPGSLFAGKQDGLLAASPPEPSRWYVLFVYSYISALQSLLWITWSSVPGPSSRFLCESSGPRGDVGSCATSPRTLDLFLDEGPIAYCCVVPLAAWAPSAPGASLPLSETLIQTRLMTAVTVHIFERVWIRISA
jgi:hypothetical protein